MMSKHVVTRCILMGVVSVLLFEGIAFGWGGPTHSFLTTRTFNDDVLAPFLGGINQSAIEQWTGEPPTALSQWGSITGRYYIRYAGDEPGGYNWWDDWDETTRLKYLTHAAADCAVPLGHSPANQEYSNTIAEAALEAQVSTWSTYPDVEGTCQYTHSETNHSFSLTGTMDQVIDEFEDAVLDNATWFKNRPKPWWLFGAHYPSDNTDAGWNGTKLALMLQRAVFADYMLSKQPTVATCGGTHVIGPGGLATFEAYGCHDPDNIEWNSNGTYSQRNTNLESYYWDFNNDGTWDFVDDDPYDARSYEYLVGLGIPAGQWHTFRLSAYDDEGTRGDYYGQLFLNPGGVPEPASLSLLVLGGLTLLRRRRR
ncbi:MAG: PEP-CTERM sorting domain-containing protein [Phycisphaerae bacterium]|nr:PEP-CTERM sorting domain-containing protein [Phycisphaerae bacterium]